MKVIFKKMNLKWLISHRIRMDLLRIVVKYMCRYSKFCHNFLHLQKNKKWRVTKLQMKKKYPNKLSIVIIRLLLNRRKEQIHLKATNWSVEDHSYVFRKVKSFFYVLPSLAHFTLAHSQRIVSCRIL